MECLSFRRAKLSAPLEVGAALLEHVRNCKPCEAFAHDIDALERGLSEAMQVSVPTGLAEQVILQQRCLQWLPRTQECMRHAIAAWIKPVSAAPGRYVSAALAMALSVTLVVAIAVLERRDAMADGLVAHVIAEPEALHNTEEGASVKFELALARYGGHMRSPVGAISYLGDCAIDGVTAQHVVVQTGSGPATLILTPERVYAHYYPREGRARGGAHPAAHRKYGDRHPVCRAGVRRRADARAPHPMGQLIILKTERQSGPTNRALMVECVFV